MKRDDIVNGSIPKTIIFLSAPTVMSMFLQTLYNTIDTIYVGRVSAEAVAALSISFPIIFLMISVTSGVSWSTNALVSKYVGAKKDNEASRLSEHSIIIGIILGLLFTITGLIFSEQIFKLMGADAEVLKLSVEYMKYVFIGAFFMAVMFVGMNILRAEGDTKTPFKVMAFSVALNTVLDPILIFGLDMGVGGAGLGTMTSRMFACFLIYMYIFKDKGHINLDFKNFKYKARYVREIVKIGVPTALTNLITSGAVTILTSIVSAYGAYAIAAYGIGFRIEGLAIVPTIGLGSGVMTVIGQNYGAKQIERAKKSAWVGSLIAMLLMGTMGVLVFFFPEIFVKIFNDHSEVLKYGSSYLIVVGPVMFLQGMFLILERSYQGFGRATTAMIMNVVRMGLMVLLSLVLMKNYGLMGVWYAIATGTVVSSLLSALVFKKLKISN